MFAEFHGNDAAAGALRELARSGRIPQTILLDGPEGVGKATLARRFASAVLGGAAVIERDDLSLPENVSTIAGREKWTAEKRNEDPLLFASHPDFVTFAPDGPLRQISIQQMRLLKERALFSPLRGSRRIFLIDRIDRANEQAANSLLKILEEPPAHLIIVMTAENPYELLSTIRSRAVPFHLQRLGEAEMLAFAALRRMPSAERRIALAAGSPGMAASLDLDSYDRRRGAMLGLLDAASGIAPFGEWAKVSEAISALRQEKLEFYLNVLYVLLADVLALAYGGEIRNRDVRPALERVARRVSFDWMRKAVESADALNSLIRRNIQKNLALDAFAIGMKRQSACGQPGVMVQ